MIFYHVFLLIFKDLLYLRDPATLESLRQKMIHILQAQLYGKLIFVIYGTFYSYWLLMRSACEYMDPVKQWLTEAIGWGEHDNELSKYKEIYDWHSGIVGKPNRGWRRWTHSEICILKDHLNPSVTFKFPDHLIKDIACHSIPTFDRGMMYIYWILTRGWLCPFFRHKNKTAACRGH